MIRLDLEDLQKIVGGEGYGITMGARGFAGVATDTRRLPVVSDDGELPLFVALRGEHFDAHEHLSDDTPAAVLLVERRLPVALPQIVVPDTLHAMQRLAQAWTRRWRASNPVRRLVALTGSNGKTTTREMIRSILAQAAPTHSTRGNLNNHIGVPLTLFELADSHRYAVIELGASARGEIGALVELVEPDVALVTNAGRAHLEGFGSLEGVARGKGEIYAGLRRDGVAVINDDDAFAGMWRAGVATRSSGRPPESPRIDGFHLAVETLAIETEDATHPRRVAAVGGQPVNLTRVNGRFDAPDRLSWVWTDGDTASDWSAVRLAAPGTHTARNALAAASVAHALDFPASAIVAGLAAWRPVAGRLTVHRHASGARVYDDTYNANPDSLVAGMAALASGRASSTASGRLLLVLGDMAELGGAARDEHARMGDEARRLGFSAIYTIGALAGEAATAFGAGGQCFDTVEALVPALAGALQGDDRVLVKGSRAARMERVIAALDVVRDEQAAAVAVDDTVSNVSQGTRPQEAATPSAS